MQQNVNIYIKKEFCHVKPIEKDHLEQIIPN